jgi:hypothetical protein
MPGIGSPTLPALRIPCSGLAVQQTVHSDNP